MGDKWSHAHGTVMILAWIVFGSTGVLFARYGRILRLGNQRQCLGKSVWFQTHRFLLSLSSLLTIVAFFLIMVYTCGKWSNFSAADRPIFAHSMFGMIVVCCVVLQIWLSLYRCHPHSPFRFIFNWIHRIIGFSAFGFALTNLFLIIFVLSDQRVALLIIVSLWAGWTLLIIVLFEIIQYQYRKASALIAANTRAHPTNQDATGRNVQHDTEAGTNVNVDNQRLNKVKLILFFIHTVVTIVFSTLLMVSVWSQN